MLSNKIREPKPVVKFIFTHTCPRPQSTVCGQIMPCTLRHVGLTVLGIDLCHRNGRIKQQCGKQPADFFGPLRTKDFLESKVGSDIKKSHGITVATG